MALLDGVELVCFDLFDTLVRVDHAQLPVVEIAGRPRPTTLPRVFDEVLAGYGVDFEDLVTAAVAVVREIAAEKEREWIEVSSVVRFERVLARLGLAGEDGESAGLAAKLAESHARHLAGATAPAEGAHAVLERVRARELPTALVSNFDYAPAADWILANTGLAGTLDRLVVSEALGVRKPHQRMFREALEAFGTGPEAAVHVGDLAKSDVWGAGRLGIATVWINPEGGPYPEAEHPPTLTLGSLGELLDHL